jgi:hypothetical protein
MNARLRALCGGLVAAGVLPLSPALAAVLGVRAAAPPPGVCAGDCGSDGQVSVDELLTMLNMAIRSLPLSTCPGGDATGDEKITIEDLVVAVTNARDGCTPQPTPTPTATPGSTTGSLASGAVVIANAMGAVRGVVAAFVTGLQVGGSGSGVCELGGAATSDSNPPFSFDITLSQCKVSTATGAVVFNGMASTSPSSFNASIDAAFFDVADAPTVRATTVINGAWGSIPDPMCFLSAIVLDIASGRLAASIPSGDEVAVTLEDTHLMFDGVTYNERCVPVKYGMTFDGAALLQTPAGELARARLHNLRLEVDERADPTLFSLDGELDSPCFGGAVSVKTEAPLHVPSGQVCPTDGGLVVTSASEVAAVRYHPGEDCLDPQLSMCRP